MVDVFPGWSDVGLSFEVSNDVTDHPVGASIRRSASFCASEEREAKRLRCRGFGERSESCQLILHDFGWYLLVLTANTTCARNQKTSHNYELCKHKSVQTHTGRKSNSPGLWGAWSARVFMYIYGAQSVRPSVCQCAVASLKESRSRKINHHLLDVQYKVAVSCIFVTSSSPPPIPSL